MIWTSWTELAKQRGACTQAVTTCCLNFGVRLTVVTIVVQLSERTPPEFRTF